MRLSTRCCRGNLTSQKGKWSKPGAHARGMEILSESGAPELLLPVMGAADTVLLTPTATTTATAAAAAANSRCMVDAVAIVVVIKQQYLLRLRHCWHAAITANIPPNDKELKKPEDERGREGGGAE